MKRLIERTTQLLSLALLAGILTGCGTDMAANPVNSLAPAPQIANLGLAAPVPASQMRYLGSFAAPSSPGSAAIRFIGNGDGDYPPPELAAPPQSGFAGASDASSGNSPSDGPSNTSSAGEAAPGNAVYIYGEALRRVSASDHDLRGRPSIGIATIEQVLKQYNSPAMGMGKAVYALGLKYNIDPAYALAFYVKESSAGTKGKAIVTKSWGNIRCKTYYPQYKCYNPDNGAISDVYSANGYTAYDFIEQGLEHWYIHIATQYIAKGLTTPEQIAPLYAPDSDGNNSSQYAAQVNAMVDQWRAEDAAAPAPGQFMALPAPTPAAGNSVHSATEAAIPTAVPDATSDTLCQGIILQVGHWHEDELPDELSDLRTSTGTSWQGFTEWQEGLSIALRAKGLLVQKGYTVTIVPATVPIGCKGDVFLAIHSDGAANPQARGFKLAAPDSDLVQNPENARLVSTIQEEYGAATGLPVSTNVTVNMTRYYAWWSGSYQHAVDSATPMALIELGYFTNGQDRMVLFDNQDAVALGVANGIDRFLRERIK